MKKFVIAFATVALAVASAAEKRTITLYSPSVIGGQELKPGDYRIVVDGNKLSIKDGKRTIEAPVKVESEAKKFDTTAVRYAADKEVTEIRLGGSNTKLVLGSSASNAN
ncbi:hypothetical protein F183_A13290 [Bryobacterales bacterium F-183]|nr:hypothetical protein F183_A13290 [Bryobacterales bacterium F-183]